MAEVPDAPRDEQGIVPLDIRGVSALLQRQVGQLMNLIHDMTGPEASRGLDQITFIHNIGEAAYHLAQAREQVQTAPVTVEASVENRDMPSLPPTLSANIQETPTPDEESAIQNITFDEQASLDETTPAGEPHATEQAPTPSDSIELPPQVIALATELGLSQQQSNLMHVILSSIPRNQWFKRSAVDLSSMKFVSETARNQAWAKLAKTLSDAAVWEQRGERFTRSYRISDSLFASSMLDLPAATGDVQQVAESLSTMTDPSTKMPETQPEILSNANLLPRAAQTMHELFTSYPGENPRLSEAKQLLASKLSITQERAKELISEFAANGDCHVISPKGKSFVVLGPALTAFRPTPAVHTPFEAASTSPSIEQDKSTAWTETDVDIAFRVFGILLTQTDIRQGFKRRAVSRDVQNGYHHEQVRLAIDKLAAKGYITLTELKLDPRVRHSRAREDNDVIVRLRDQKLKDDLARDRSVIRAELRALIQS